MGFSHIRLNLSEVASMAEESSYSFSEEGDLEQIGKRCPSHVVVLNSSKLRPNTSSLVCVCFLVLVDGVGPATDPVRIIGDIYH
jgi:hypothetical protein